MSKNDYVLWPFLAQHDAEVINFIAEHSWPIQWPQGLVHRFLSGLISSPRLVFDVTALGERVAVAVLIDKVQNTKNDASLEILAKMDAVSPPDLLHFLLPEVKARLPKGKAGFCLSIPANQGELEETALQHKLEKFYEMFEMVWEGPATSRVSGTYQIEEAREHDEEELFAALKHAFKDNVDANISTFEEWTNARAKNKQRRTNLVRNKGKIAGFLHLDYSEKVAQITTIGVLPEYRGKGIGEQLLSFCLANLPIAHHEKCKLSVATQNQKALNLYQRNGFKVVDHFLVFRWSRK